MRSNRPAEQVLEPGETSLLDLVDNLLNRGVILDADLILGVADVDLVYLKLGALLCAVDRLFSAPVPRLPLPKGRRKKRSARR